MRLIDADVTYNVLTDYYHQKTPIQHMALKEALDRVPTAQPERKKGKWIEFGSIEDKYDVIRCPCCKYIFAVDSYHLTDIGFIKDDFKFCPNCGADMREREKNETN